LKGFGKRELLGCRSKATAILIVGSIFFHFTAHWPI